jgi:multiple sugar transport system permease protein
MEWMVPPGIRKTKIPKYRSRGGGMKKKRSKYVSYAKWGYIFLIPFFLVYIVFSLIPLFSTFYNSFFENYMTGLQHIGPKFIGFANYKSILFDSELPMYLKNTLIMWIMGFIPQIIFSLLLASWFTDLRLRLKCTGFFKTIIYMPNLIMASAFAMLFYAIFSDAGPINNMLNSMGIPTYRFLSEVMGARGLVALMNFLMWFGNTTIILMAGIMGIDTGLFEAARIDGANSWQIFKKITLPLIKPITAYVLITSLIGGIQMFDVPQILTNGNGNPDRTSMTVIMFLNKHLYSKNYGMAGALSVILFIITAILSVFVYKYITKDMDAVGAKKKHRKEAKV